MEQKKAAEILMVASGLVLVAAARKSRLGTLASLVFGASLALLFTKGKASKLGSQSVDL